MDKDRINTTKGSKQSEVNPKTRTSFVHDLGFTILMLLVKILVPLVCHKLNKPMIYPCNSLYLLILSLKIYTLTIFKNIYFEIKLCHTQISPRITYVFIMSYIFFSLFQSLFFLSYN